MIIKERASLNPDKEIVSQGVGMWAVLCKTQSKIIEHADDSTAK